jgi:hypothetical protein
MSIFEDQLEHSLSQVNIHRTLNQQLINLQEGQSLDPAALIDVSLNECLTEGFGDGLKNRLKNMWSDLVWQRPKDQSQVDKSAERTKAKQDKIAQRARQKADRIASRAQAAYARMPEDQRRAVAKYANQNNQLAALTTKVKDYYKNQVNNLSRNAYQMADNSTSQGRNLQTVLSALHDRLMASIENWTPSLAKAGEKGYTRQSSGLYKSAGGMNDYSI